jgi:2-polyprenyl-3-methyl-5-hydroxy-6-metoxy-1,4-benzoquinol methylase
MKKKLAVLVHRLVFWLAGEILDELPNLRRPFVNSLVPVVERVYPDDPGLRPQTIVHHLKRYWFATQLQKQRGWALDYACGSGYGTEILREAGYRAYGVDINEEAIAYAKKHFPACDFALKDFADIGTPPGEYDLITLFEAIEHLGLQEGKECIKTLGRYLNENGVMVISLPKDLDSDRNGFHKSYWDRFVLAAYLGEIFKEVGVVYQNWNAGEIGPRVEPNFYIFVCRKSKYAQT